MRRHDKALYCGSLYLSTYTPILCCDFLSITGNFGACGNSQDSRTQFSRLGWPKKVLIMFPATFSFLFYWFRWLNWTKNIYRFLLHFLPILELISYSSNSRFRFLHKLRSEGACCPPARNPLDANYDSIADEPQLNYYLVPPWWPCLNEIGLMYLHK